MAAIPNGESRFALVFAECPVTTSNRDVLLNVEHLIDLPVAGAPFDVDDDVNRNAECFANAVMGEGGRRR